VARPYHPRNCHVNVRPPRKAQKESRNHDHRSRALSQQHDATRHRTKPFIHSTHGYGASAQSLALREAATGPPRLTLLWPRPGHSACPIDARVRAGKKLDASSAVPSVLGCSCAVGALRTCAGRRANSRRHMDRDGDAIRLEHRAVGPGLRAFTERRWSARRQRDDHEQRERAAFHGRGA
jgi:hypothetical protein